MWVADMDFSTAPAITEAVLTKALPGVFGYSLVPQRFGEVIAEWWLLRYGWPLSPEWVVFCEGVVPAISSIVRTLTNPGDGVIVQPPVYDSFYSCVRHSSRSVVANYLTYTDGKFQFDWPDLQAKLADAKARLMLLCNPQNPTGQLWSSDDLARLATMAAKRGVPVVSDEIHCDLTAPGVRYTPFGVANPNSPGLSITLVSATKSFNIPGLRTAAVIIADPNLRARIAAGLKRDEIVEPNSFAIDATIAAYTAGGEWLDQARSYIWANKLRLESYIAENLPQLGVIPSQATYLSWIDCRRLAPDANPFCRFLREHTGLILNPGGMYGDNTTTFMRMNLACPSSRLEDALRRLTLGVEAWQAR
jgi:cystathionine beta-lyase